MKKGLLFVFLFFGGVVVINYFIIQMSSLRFALVPIQTSKASDNGLSSVNFNFFAQNGIGKDYITQGYGVTPYSYLYADHWHDGVDIDAVYGASNLLLRQPTVRFLRSAIRIIIATGAVSENMSPWKTTRKASCRGTRTSAR